MLIHHQWDSLAFVNTLSQKPSASPLCVGGSLVHSSQEYLSGNLDRSVVKVCGLQEPQYREILLQLSIFQEG